MRNRSSLLTILFIFFMVCIAVVIGVRGKWAALAVADRPSDTYLIKHTGYYDTRAITGADGQTEIPPDRINNNNFSTNMIDDLKGVSSSSTMALP